MRDPLELAVMQLNKEIDNKKRDKFNYAEVLEYGFKILGYLNKQEARDKQRTKRKCQNIFT